MAWYRTYRPKKVQDLNITSVREILERMMKDGKLPQSLLFAGPKGTGKTSASRIIGAMLNDPANAALVDYLFFKKDAPKNNIFAEPDETSDFAKRVYEGHSFVVQELDAASNRRIDDIRLLRERINLPPSEGKMMVYILDEVHMLTNEAFNALLKILEEPPSHVVFILATTELHKIPATIVSRCSLINFRKATSDELKEALERVLKAEKIKYDEADVDKIVFRADGSFRDGVKILEMACKGGKLDLESVKSLLASDNEAHVKSILEAVVAKDEKTLAKIFQNLRDNNYNQKDFYRDFVEFLHKDLLRNLAVIEESASYSIKIDQFFLKEVLSVDLNQETPVPFLVLELKLLEIIERSKKSGDEPKKPEKPEKKQEKPKPKEKSVEPEPKPEPKKEAKKEESKDSKKKIQKIAETDSMNFWPKLVQNFSGNFSLVTLLKSCKFDCISEEIARVFVYYPFHKEQLEQNKNRELLKQASKELLGLELGFEFVLQEAALAAAPAEAESDLVLAAKDSLL